MNMKGDSSLISQFLGEDGSLTSRGHPVPKCKTTSCREDTESLLFLSLSLWSVNKQGCPMILSAHHLSSQKSFQPFVSVEQNSFGFSLSLTAVTLNKVSFTCLIFALTVISPGWKGQNFNFGLPDSSVGKRIRLQCRRPQFDPWAGKIPWRRERLPTPVFWPGEFRGLYSPWSCKEGDRTEPLSGNPQ